MATLAALTVLPLGIIAVQLALGLNGAAGYSLYKIFLLVPPLVYCWRHGIRPGRDILRPGNWRQCLPGAVGLGIVAVAVFWGAYWALGDFLLDKSMIAGKIGVQFGVTPRTVLMVAPLTIFLNSLLEEFFYRGFAFGLLLRASARGLGRRGILPRPLRLACVVGHAEAARCRFYDARPMIDCLPHTARNQQTLAYLLPAAAFTTQHLLFIYHWVTPIPFLLAAVGLFLFALVLERLYEKAGSIVAPWVVHVLGDVAMMGIAMTMLW